MFTSIIKIPIRLCTRGTNVILHNMLCQDIHLVITQLLAWPMVPLVTTSTMHGRRCRVFTINPTYSTGIFCSSTLCKSSTHVVKLYEKNLVASFGSALCECCLKKRCLCFVPGRYLYAARARHYKIISMMTHHCDSTSANCWLVRDYLYWIRQFERFMLRVFTFLCENSRFEGSFEW